MKFTLALPTDELDRPEEFGTAAAIGELAAAAEEVGFTACHVTDHPFPPGPWVRAGGHHALDPLVTLALAAATTTRLRLQTSVFIPAYRNPFIAAKGVATLDAVSGGRVILGVAAGYLEPEFAALGAPFEQRGRTLEAAIAMMKLAWTGQDVTADGPGWSARGNAMLPTPVSRPHPPIWIGGNAPVARRRAVALGEGWCPFPARGRLATAVRTAELGGIADLRRAIDHLAEEAANAGRTAPLDICVIPFTHTHHRRPAIDAAALRDEVAELADLGVTWVSIRLPAETRRELLRAIEDFGAEIISDDHADGVGR